MQQVDSEPPPLRRPPGVGDVPASVARVIMDNLSKSPEGRVENARYFARAIVRAAATSQLTIENYGPDSALWDDMDYDESGIYGDGSPSTVLTRDPGTP